MQYVVAAVKLLEIYIVYKTPSGIEEVNGDCLLSFLEKNQEVSSS